MSTGLLTPSRIEGVPESREIGDIDATRTNIYARTLQAAQQVKPIENQQYRLGLENVNYEGPETYSLADQKQALLSGRSLGRRLRGEWVLRNREDDKEVDRKRLTLADVPYLTPRGTYIFNGSEYGLSHQMRLRPGIFTRAKESGELESHVNVAQGFGHRYFLDPESGVFRIQMGQARMPLLPVLKALGAKDAEIRASWGNELWSANVKKDDPKTLKKIFAKIKRGQAIPDDPREINQVIRDTFAEMRLDPDVTRRTLGQPFDRVDPATMLASTQRLLGVMRGEQDPDDRDALGYQKIVGPEDIFAERFQRGAADVRRLLWKSTFPGNLQRAQPGTFKRAMQGALLETGLGSPLEEINPSELYDQLHRVTRMGEGGIPSMDSIPDEARNVQPSHFGFIDPVHTPESSKIGVDSRMTTNTRVGTDGRPYSLYRDAKTGQKVWKSPQDLADQVMAFPGELARGDDHVLALSGGRQRYVPRETVDVELANMDDSFGPLANMVPLKSAVFPQRVAMGSRMLTQALPLVDGEAPLVRSGRTGSDGDSFEAFYGRRTGAVKSDVAGTVVDVTDDGIKIRGTDRKIHNVELYNNHPYNRKTFLHNTAVVRPGDVVKVDQLLARSNFTDGEGVTALGKNLRVAYIPYKGFNFEDAIVMSESAATRMSSEHMYQHGLDIDPATKANKNAYVSSFPGVYDRELLANYDDDGVVKVGTKVNMDEPLILAVKQRKTGPQLGRRKRSFADASVKWEHHAPGFVTDVFKGKKGINVVVKSTQPSEVGDKFAGRYGDKGVIAAIIPDEEMPHGADGKPFELLLNPLGVISRGNPAQVLETALGKIAVHDGKPISPPDFGEVKDLRHWIATELQKRGLSSTEVLTDPDGGRNIPGIMTGNRFIMKLHHTAEGKLQGRGTGAYTAEGAPAKGGKDGSKRVGMLEMNALLSHGAYANVQDASVFRGQQNEDRWRQIMSGYSPPNPSIPHVYTKFVEQLRGSGINPIKSGTKLNVYALGGSDVDELVGPRRLQNVETVEWKTDRLAPKKGGLFDESLTGGHGGNRWSYIQLAEPMPSPVMEEPIRRILGLTEKEYRNIIGGSAEVTGRFAAKPGDPDTTGPAGLVAALGRINIDREIKLARAEIAGGRKTYRDAAIRRLGFLKAAKKQDKHPSDWIWNKMPVLPPAFRPISVMGSTGIPLIQDSNYLYKEVFDASEGLKSMKGQIDDVSDERLALYDSMKGVTGLGDPIQPKNKETKVKGILKHVFGSAPKHGVVQRKLLGSTVDLTGRATITPNPNLDMDQVAVPREQAWAMYQPFIVRRLVRKGMPKVAAMEQVKNKSKSAEKELLAEMEVRPVIVTRAPVLHRYGIMAFRPQIAKSKTMEVAPLIVGGFGADFDGDAQQIHVPSSDDAVREAYEKLLPSQNLLSASGFDVHYTPTQEFISGLWAASSKVNKKKPARVFNSEQDAVRAYRRGEINIDQRVEIAN